MVKLELREIDAGRVAVLRIENPPVNSVGSAVRVSLAEQLEQALSDTSVKAVVLTGAGKFFSGGADIREFNTPKAAVRPSLRELIAQIEVAEKPVVAAINGTALGGGLELTLGCHGRVAGPAVKLGLPEVKLGVLPGAGGTQRLPRLIGLDAALDIIVGGEPVTAAQALEYGLVDHVDEDPVAKATELALAIAQGVRAPRRVDHSPLDMPAGAAAFDSARKNAERRYRGCIAPLEAIACVEKTLTTKLEEGLEFERERFQYLVNGDQSKAQRHIFFAERKAAKLPPAEPADVVIRRVGVVGAGTMGGGIAMSLANAGLSVVLMEQSEAALDRGWATIVRNYDTSQRRGRFTAAEVEERLARIQRSVDYADFSDADLVIEAAFEDMDVKKEIFSRLDAVCRPDAILASNTSRLDIDEIASVTSRPARVLGMHFFSPANVMRLLEVVKGAQTSHAVLAAVFGLATRIGKVPVLVGVCDGFVGNRMVSHYTREAYFLLEEGATPAQIDGALRRFGMAMGPLQMQDMAGLDISWAARKRQASTRPAHLRYSKVADRICEMGRFGQKTGSGFYRYEPGTREPIPDPEVHALIEQCAAEAGIVRRNITDEEIVQRTIFALVNEAAKIVQDGIAQRPSDIDVVYVAGYGFPMFRGGPMFYADTVGLTHVLDTIRQFHKDHGEYWTPAPLLEELVRSGRRFSDL